MGASQLARSNRLSRRHFEWFLTQKQGEAANLAQFRKDLEAISSLYRNRGYLRANLEPARELDENTATASYRVEVDEGGQYRMGRLLVEGGIQPQDRARIEKRWELQPGEVFDLSYLSQFIDSELAFMFRKYKIKKFAHQLIVHPDLSVDVKLTFR